MVRTTTSPPRSCRPSWFVFLVPLIRVSNREGSLPPIISSSRILGISASTVRCILGSAWNVAAAVHSTMLLPCRPCWAAPQNADKGHRGPWIYVCRLAGHSVHAPFGPLGPGLPMDDISAQLLSCDCKALVGLYVFEPVAFEPA